MSHTDTLVETLYPAGPVERRILRALDNNDLTSSEARRPRSPARDDKP